MAATRQSSSRLGLGWALESAWVPLALFSIFFLVWFVSDQGLFGFVGVDYRAFRASAEIARSGGFAQVYDLATQEQFQRPLYDACSFGDSRVVYATVPVPYLPVFILPFLAFLLFPPVPGFIVWTVLNLSAMVLYMFRLKKMLGCWDRFNTFAMVLFCFPAFLNLFFGQVNVWLFICMGEFLIASTRGQSFRSGLWLSGLLLKPQALFLLLPGLLIGRRFKAFVGCAAGGLIVLLISLLLGGGQGVLNAARLVLLYSRGVQTNVPESMMNWRALEINLVRLIPSPIAWGIAIAGLVLSCAAALSLWLHRGGSSSSSFNLVVMGTYAATCTVAWHAHVHMALPLVIPLLFLESRQLLPRGWLIAWLVVPTLAFVVTIVVLPSWMINLMGQSLLILNACLVVWAARSVWRKPAVAEHPNGPALAV